MLGFAAEGERMQLMKILIDRRHGQLIYGAGVKITPPAALIPNPANDLTDQPLPVTSPCSCQPLTRRVSLVAPR
jgi:hypothetical protein